MLLTRRTPEQSGYCIAWKVVNAEVSPDGSKPAGRVWLECVRWECLHGWRGLDDPSTTFTRLNPQYG